MATDPTTALDTQDNFSTTLSADVTTTSQTTISLTSLPTPTEGYLVIDKGTTSKREVIHYTSKGSGTVICPSAGDRGINGTAYTHTSGDSVHMLMNKAYWDALQSAKSLDDSGITPRKIDSIYSRSAGTGADINAAGSSAWTTLTGAAISYTTAVTSTIFCSVYIEAQDNSTASTLDVRLNIVADGKASNSKKLNISSAGLNCTGNYILELTGVTAGAKTIQVEFRSANTTTFVQTTECEVSLLSVTSEA